MAETSVPMAKYGGSPLSYKEEVDAEAAAEDGLLLKDEEVAVVDRGVGVLLEACKEKGKDW